MTCPYFQRQEDLCDIGLGYISPYDVQTISNYCATHHTDCLRFRQLCDKVPSNCLGPRTTPVNPRSAARSDRAPLSIRFRNKWPLSHRLALSLAQGNQFTLHKEETMNSSSNRQGWIVALAGTGINLALGILYTWSIFKGAITDSIAAGGPFTWAPASVNDPYAVACLVFAAAMIIAGKLQDKFGPRVTCILGGLLVAAGFVWISQTTNYWSWMVGFGVLAGMGIGFGYSAATPPALKWFPPAKTGLIAGIVVSGFGLASVYIAPLAKWLLGSYGLQKSMMFFGIGFGVVVCGLAMLIKNPPQTASAKTAAKAASANDMTPMQILKTGKFYTLWLCYFIGSGAGLMVIGSAKGLAKASMGEMAFLVVAIMSIGNAAGRLVAGILSDKLGRANTLTLMLFLQAVLMFAAFFGLNAEAQPEIVALLVTFMVFNYGTNLSLFPSFAKDYWGMKNFGMNYGILFSAWGIGAAVLVRVAEMIKVQTGSFTANFAVATVMLLIGTVMAFSLRPRAAAVKATASELDELAEEDLLLQENRS